MIFLISLALVALFIIFCGKTLRSHPAPFYIAAIALACFVSLSYGNLNFPSWFNSWIWPLIARSGISGALFVAVMYAGAMPNGSKPVKHIMPIRGELSILASILTLGHNSVYGRTYFARLTSLKGTTLAASICSILMLCIMLPLFITSFKKIRKKMKGKTWKRLQRWAYLFYALMYLHVMLLTIPAALKGRSGYLLTIFVYTLVFATYAICRVLKARAIKTKTTAKLPKRQLVGLCCGVLIALVLLGGIYAACAAQADAMVESTTVVVTEETEEATATTEPEEAEESASSAEVITAAAAVEQSSEETTMTTAVESATAEEATVTVVAEAAESADVAEETDDVAFVVYDAETGETSTVTASATQSEGESATSSSLGTATETAATESATSSSSTGTTETAAAVTATESTVQETQTTQETVEVVEVVEVVEETPSYVYKDGTFTGSAQGYYGAVVVSVTISADVITGITVTSFQDDDLYFDDARAVISSILASQSTAVDAVSGATYSSKGIINAVANALASAKN